jgi:hypothetical protein
MGVLLGLGVCCIRARSETRNQRAVSALSRGILFLRARSSKIKSRVFSLSDLSEMMRKALLPLATIIM